MALSALEMVRLRRMVREPDAGNGYTDGVLQEMAARYPLPDGEGRDPDHPEWLEGYDLAATAADVWLEKAAASVGGFDFEADGSSYRRSQAYEQALRQAGYWRSRRVAVPRRLRVHL